MAKKVFDAVASIREEGREKPRYLNVGSVIEGEKGMSLKLDMVPVGVGWNGWISFYPVKAKEEANPARAVAFDDAPF